MFSDDSTNHPAAHSIKRKVEQVLTVFKTIDEDTARFQQATGLHCFPKCNGCCIRPHIEATILEFLPLAYHLYLENQAEEWWNRMKEMTTDPHCGLLKPRITAEKGFCIAYDYRPLVCRLFGYSAVLDKNQRPQLATCEILKKNRTEIFQKAVADIEKGLPVPVMKNYFFHLYSIDMTLTREFYDISTALFRALEEVLFFSSYEKWDPLCLPAKKEGG